MPKGRMLWKRRLIVATSSMIHCFDFGRHLCLTSRLCETWLVFGSTTTRAMPGLRFAKELCITDCLDLPPPPTPPHPAGAARRALTTPGGIRLPAAARAAPSTGPPRARAAPDGCERGPPATERADPPPRTGRAAERSTTPYGAPTARTGRKSLATATARTVSFPMRPNAGGSQQNHMPSEIPKVQPFGRLCTLSGDVLCTAAWQHRAVTRHAACASKWSACVPKRAARRPHRRCGCRCIGCQSSPTTVIVCLQRGEGGGDGQHSGSGYDIHGLVTLREGHSKVRQPGMDLAPRDSGVRCPPPFLNITGSRAGDEQRHDTPGRLRTALARRLEGTYGGWGGEPEGIFCSGGRRSDSDQPRW